MSTHTTTATTAAATEYRRPADFTLVEDDNLARLAWRQAEARPQHVSFETFHGGTWHGITATTHLERVINIARGLVSLGVEPGDRVAIMSGTRYSWLLIDSGIWAAGGVTVPIYPSSSASQVEWIIRDSGAKLLFVETEAMHHLLADADLGDTHVLVMDVDALAVVTGRAAETPAHVVDERVAAVTLDDAASIVYTSGTTGRPKGCVATHANLAAEARALLSQPIGKGAAGVGKRTLMFLPLAHVLARAVTYAVSAGGSTVGFWADTSTLTDKLQTFRPNLVLGVPRVFEKVHEAARAKARAGGSAKAEVFRRAERVAIEWSRTAEAAQQGGKGPSLRLRAEHAAFDRLVYKPVRDALGGECEYAISGGGAMRADLQHFFSGLGVPAFEGYGLTETCAAIAVNEPGSSKVGTVGRPVKGNAIRISDAGEIQLKGLVVFKEYWHNPDATEAAFEDGWFRTGDLGSLDANGFLTVTGRQKEIIVTAGGKNVAPGPLEESLRTDPLVGHAVLIGEGRPFISALVTLDPDGAAAWATDNGKDAADLVGLATDPALLSSVQTAVDQANSLVSHAEGIKKFTVVPTDFTEDGGELTATLKVKRHVVEHKYDHEIKAMYRRR